MNRTIFLIDGFNVYHSAKHASRDLRGATTKWLDLYSLCSSVLYLVGRGAELTSIFYFSALAKHLLHSNPDTVKRHEDYMKCLETTGIIIDLARFKEKRIKCNYCNRTNIRHEEKETDVAIAAKLFELFYTNSCDIIVIVTGDTDLSPAVRTAQLLFPEKRILFAFPYRHRPQEIADLAPGSFRLKKERYLQHQFPDPVALPDGNEIHKPESW